MQLKGAPIAHKFFGKGTVTQVDEKVITVSFARGEKQFLFPDAFSNFLTFKSQTLQKEIEELLQEQQQLEDRRLFAEREEETRMIRLRKLKLLPNSQAAFGLVENTREQAFADWALSSGRYLSGASKGRPRPPAAIKANSACLITQRPAGGTEAERRILGAFMVPDDFDGALCTDGLVPSHRNYKLELEAETPLLFWSYFAPAEQPARWGKTEIRYLSTETMQKILHDIFAATTDLAQKKVAAGFYQYFCTVNRLSPQFELHPAAGA